MAQYKIIIDKEDLHQLFNQDQGMARLLEKVLNTFRQVEEYKQIVSLVLISRLIRLFPLSLAAIMVNNSANYSASAG